MDRPRRRRRLRREVRLVGCLALLVASIATASFLLGDIGDDGDAQSTTRRPAVSLSIESTAFASRRSPVVLPGYLLPADNLEEAIDVGR